jgi:hypothetical protein
MRKGATYIDVSTFSPAPPAGFPMQLRLKQCDDFHEFFGMRGNLHYSGRGFFK